MSIQQLFVLIFSLSLFTLNGGCDSAPSLPTIPGGTSGPIDVMANAADIIESIKDAQSLQAAEPKLRAMQGEFAGVRPVLTTAVFISGEFPMPDAQMKAEMMKQARENPEFKPYLADAEALARDPRFK